ncbi:unnamed protein product [Closterium sp. NIES-54]
MPADPHKTSPSSPPLPLLPPSPIRSFRSSQAEIEVLSSVRHRHLLGLLGYAVEGNERVLVYQLMARGPLSRHLFDHRRLALPPLTWRARVSVALDVARGVEYLHSLAHTSFIHRDLKASNILLDEDMRARVADFGLVKHSKGDGMQSIETRIAGTFGYLAPEYAVTGRVTTRSDVYSYGVVLMELITGRRALDDSKADEAAHLATWLAPLVPLRDQLAKVRGNRGERGAEEGGKRGGRWGEDGGRRGPQGRERDVVIDPVLLPEMPKEHGSAHGYGGVFSSVCAVADLAVTCVARDPRQRPTMGGVVGVLAPLLQQQEREEEEARKEHGKQVAEEDVSVAGIDLGVSLAEALLQWQHMDAQGPFNTPAPSDAGASASARASALLEVIADGDAADAPALATASAAPKEAIFSPAPATAAVAVSAAAATGTAISALSQLNSPHTNFHSHPHHISLVIDPSPSSSGAYSFGSGRYAAMPAALTGTGTPGDMTPHVLTPTLTTPSTTTTTSRSSSGRLGSSSSSGDRSIFLSSGPLSVGSDGFPTPTLLLGSDGYPTPSMRVGSDGYPTPSVRDSWSGGWVSDRSESGKRGSGERRGRGSFSGGLDAAGEPVSWTKGGSFIIKRIGDQLEDVLIEKGACKRGGRGEEETKGLLLCAEDSLRGSDGCDAEGFRSEVERVRKGAEVQAQQVADIGAGRQRGREVRAAGGKLMSEVVVGAGVRRGGGGEQGGGNVKGGVGGGMSLAEQYLRQGSWEGGSSDASGRSIPTFIQPRLALSGR